MWKSFEPKSSQHLRRHVPWGWKHTQWDESLSCYARSSRTLAAASDRCCTCVYMGRLQITVARSLAFFRTHPTTTPIRRLSCTSLCACACICHDVLSISWQPRIFDAGAIAVSYHSTQTNLMISDCNSGLTDLAESVSEVTRMHRCIRPRFPPGFGIDFGSSLTVSIGLQHSTSKASLLKFCGSSKERLWTLLFPQDPVLLHVHPPTDRSEPRCEPISYPPYTTPR